MCVIAYVENQEDMPGLDMLVDMEQANPDGGGYACRTPNDKILWRKGISAINMRDGILAGRIIAPAAFHFRIATSGGVKPALCHPFPLSRTISTALSGTANSVLFHNGHWIRGEQIMDIFDQQESKFKGPWSDSRAMALAVHRGLMKPTTIAREAGRLLVFNPDAQLLYGSWEKRDGVHVSNTFWDDFGFGGSVSAGHHLSWQDKIKKIRDENTSLVPYNGPGSNYWHEDEEKIEIEIMDMDDPSVERPKNGDALVHWASSGFASEGAYNHWRHLVRDEEDHEGYAG